ncbi:hypothetical protein RhiirC2_799116, partial [Rhizophagus irregularis]
QLLGTVILSSEGKPYVWKAVDITSERKNNAAVINKTEAMLTELKNKEITVCAIVTDSASAYAAARRRMRISNRSIIFLPCFAHQINLCVGEIFKESTEFKITVDRGIRLATYFNNSNHKFFIGHLRNQQYETYKKHIAISVPGETRWNSLYNMCVSLLKTQQALQQGETPTLPREIFEIIDSSTFWDQITLINEILDPYCKLLNLLQCDKARLFQVVHSMNYLVQFWLNYSDDTLAKRIIGRLEKRWKDWEQPLLLLSYLLHPEYRMNQFNNTISSVNYSAFGKWLMYYYRAWSGKEPKCILPLQMSKLRAEITYGQCLHNNLPSIEPTLDINNANKTDINQHFNNINGLENVRDNKNDFSEYLQGWAEMLEEEKNVELDEETEEQSNTQIGDVTHPANDTSTKWDLLTLFNNIDVNLPFQ